MNKKSPLFLMIFLTFFFACTSKKKNIISTDFIVSIKSLKGDTIIRSALIYDGYILCLQEDNKLVILDSCFNKVDSLIDKFSKVEFQSLNTYNDTILLSTNKEILFLDNGFELKKYQNQPFNYGLPFYNDSTYYVYACSIGEWGGSVFFLNKKTKKTYSFPATCVQQVLKFKGNYIVSSYLHHLSGFSDYLSINEPKYLYELTDKNKKRHCNWWANDSINPLKLFDTMTPQGVKYYSDKFSTKTISVFPYNDNLYSIYSTDSAIILAKHINFKLVPVDTLLKRKISFNSASTHLQKNIILTTYKENWASIDENKNIIKHQNTGLICIKDNKITFIEYKTP